jgi:hypothetical protein
MTTKTLEDVQADLSAQYEAVKAGELDMSVSAEMTNIMGKFLKATALEFAREAFLAERPTVRKRLTDAA